MFSVADKISNVVSFDVSKYGFFYLTTDITIPNIPSLDIKSTGATRAGSLFVSGDTLCWSDYDQIWMLYSLTDSKIIRLQNGLKDQIPDNQKYKFSSTPTDNPRTLYCVAKYGDTSKYYIFDIDTLAFNEINYSCRYSFDSGELLLSVNNLTHKLTRVSKDGTVLWQYDFSGEFTALSGTKQQNGYRKLIGRHKGRLWVSDKQGVVYSLNEQTGKLEHKSADYGYAYFLALDSTGEKLVSLRPKTMHMVNLKNDSFTHSHFDVSNTFKEAGFDPQLRTQAFPVVGNHVLFCDSFKAVVGAFNIQTKQLDWTFDLHETRDFAGVTEFRYIDNHLYVLDNSKTLHVFKRS